MPGDRLIIEAEGGHPLGVRIGDPREEPADLAQLTASPGGRLPFRRR